MVEATRRSAIVLSPKVKASTVATQGVDRPLHYLTCFFTCAKMV